MIPALFQVGDFPLTGGGRSRWKIECDALGEEDWQALALMLAERLPHPFGYVCGVPRGGAPLARALLTHVSVGIKRVLVVDDVWTTGGSMTSFVNRLDLGGLAVVDRAVVFARNPPPPEVTALFVMTGGNE